MRLEDEEVKAVPTRCKQSYIPRKQIELGVAILPEEP